eukprot:scaffold1786_cov398-Prasinococcus_capsulatus_cf.AAC.6
MAQWSTHVSFPELGLMVCYQLRRYIKKSPVDRFRRAAKKLVENIEKNAKWVEEHRRKIDFSPKDVAQQESFLREERESSASPLMKYNSHMQEQSQERRRQFEMDEMTVGAQPVADLKEDRGVDDDKVFGGDWMPAKKPSSSGEAVDLTKGARPKKGKEKREKKREPTVDHEGADGDEDVLGLMDVFSDDEEDGSHEGQEKASKRVKTKKRKKRST